jgi:hypothetical protein
MCVGGHLQCNKTNPCDWLHVCVIITQSVTRYSLIPAAVTAWSLQLGHYCRSCSIILQNNSFTCTAVICITDKRKQTKVLIHYTWRNVTTSPADYVFWYGTCTPLTETETPPIVSTAIYNLSLLCIYFSKVICLVRVMSNYRDAKIPNARSPRLFNFVRWRRGIVGPHCGTCFISLMCPYDF